MRAWCPARWGLALWTACGTPPPCDPATCETLTAASVAPAPSTPAPGERVITAREQALLGQRWADWVAGPRTQPGKIALNLCASLVDCPAPLSTSAPLGAGTYGVHVALRLPRDGTWKAWYERRCETSAGTPPSEDVQRELTLVPDADGLFARPIDRMDVGATPWRGRCALSLRVGEGALEHRYVLDASFAHGVD